MARIPLALGATLVLALPLVAGVPAAVAAGPTAVITNVTYDPPSGPTDPLCTAPLPSKGGTGNASYHTADGTAHSEWEWTVPATLTAGATAHTKVTETVTNNSGGSAAIALKPTTEMGADPASRSQIIAEVPVGAPGT